MDWLDNYCLHSFLLSTPNHIQRREKFKPWVPGFIPEVLRLMSGFTIGKLPGK